MKPDFSFLIVSAIALLTGCANVRPAPTAPAAPEETHELSATLANYERLTTLKTEEQRNEFNAAQSAYDRIPNDETRLNLALALVLPRAPWRNDARAESLLSSIGTTAGKQDSARHGLAQLLLRLMAERQQVLRDDKNRMDQLVSQLREERRRSEELEHKIELLRNIDREMRLPRKGS